MGLVLRLQFQDTPWDLYAVIVYTLLATAILLALGVGNLFAILLVLFVPGYVVVAALFPRDGELEWVNRIALSFGLSIAIVPLLGLLLNFTPWGIRLLPILVGVAIITGASFAIAWLRRLRLPSHRRLSVVLTFPAPRTTESTVAGKVLTIVLVASVVIAFGSLAYVLMSPRPSERFTEFYLLGPGREASDYPTNLSRSQSGEVIIGLANHESATVAYFIRVELVGIRTFYDPSCNCNLRSEANRSILSTFVITLDDGSSWVTPFVIRIETVGDWRVDFLLFRDGEFTKPYRMALLFIHVS